MLKICKMRADHVVDFAAEEFKKYLRMMMPECGDVDIVFNPKAMKLLINTPNMTKITIPKNSISIPLIS